MRASFERAEERGKNAAALDAFGAAANPTNSRLAFILDTSCQARGRPPLSLPQHHVSEHPSGMSPERTASSVERGHDVRGSPGRHEGKIRPWPPARRSFRATFHAAAAVLRRAREPTKLSPAKPSSIIAQVEVSGAVVIVIPKIPLSSGAEKLVVY